MSTAKTRQSEETQAEIPLIDAYRMRLMGERLNAACAAVAKDMGFKACADELDQIFGPIGHPVSSTVLAAALGDRERNYTRAEWLPYFASKSEEVREIIDEASGGLRELTPEEELDVLREMVNSEFGPAGQRVVNKARAARRRR